MKKIIVLFVLFLFISCAEDTTILEHKEMRIEVSFYGDVNDFVMNSQICDFHLSVTKNGDLYKGDSLIISKVYTSKRQDFLDKEHVFYKKWNSDFCVLDFHCTGFYVVKNDEEKKTMGINVKVFQYDKLITDTSYEFKALYESEVDKNDKNFIDNYKLKLEI